MAAAPILLVADDLSLIAAVKRVLAREGYECLLATNAADAVIAWGHALPGLVLLQPSVESERGAVVLEELQLHPDAQLLHLVLLGETVPGFAYPVEPLPIDGPHLASTIEENVRAPAEATGWTVHETQPSEPPPRAPETTETEAWRTTAPLEVSGAPDEGELPDPVAVDASATPPGPASPALEERLFGDLEASQAPPPDAPAPALPSRAAAALARAEKALAETRTRAQVARRDDTDAAAQLREALATQEQRAQASAAELQEARAAADAAGEAHGRAVAALETRLAEAERAHDATRAELDSLREGLASETGQRGSLEQETLELRASLAGESSRRKTLELERDEARTARDAAQSALASLEARAAELEQVAEDVTREKTARHALEEVIAAREVTIGSLEESLATARDDADAALALASELEAERAQFTEARAQVEVVTGQLTEARAALDAARAERLEVAAAREALQQELSDAQSRLESMQADVTSASELLEETARERDTLRAKVATLEPSGPLAAQLATALEEEQARRADAEAGLAATTEALDAERTARGNAEQELDALRESRTNETMRRTQAEADLAALREALDAETTRREHAERDAVLQRDAFNGEAALREQAADELATLRAAASDAATKRADLEQALADAEAKAVAQATREAAQREALEQGHADTLAAEVSRREALEQAVAAAEEASAAQAARREALEQALAAAEQASAAQTARREAVEQALAAAEHASAAETARREALEQALAAARTQAEETAATEAARRESAEEALATSRARADEAAAAEAARREALEQALAAEAQTRAQAERDAAALREATVADELRRQREAAELEALRQSLEALEAREVLSIALPHRTVGVPRHGTVTLEGLARVVTQLVLADIEVRLELGVAGGTRTLWFKRGQVVAAESSLDHESLIARARRDGLIDARQDGELRMMKAAPPREQLEALKARGFIRDIESVPLVQRYTEQVALDGFAEPQCQYRLVEEAPPAAVLLATVPRPTLPMLAESLRRAVPPDEVLERLGGGDAVAFSTDSELDLRALGFSERERKMLSWVDGEATVEDLSLASGLKPDAAFRALLVARWLGLLELKAGLPRTEPAPGQLDERRLEAKYEEVQDADYFTILGLPRSAGADEVRRAFERLSQEFDPLRFSGHPDAGLQQRAQLVAELLEEAARALEDDRRRVEYARHLLD